MQVVAEQMKLPKLSTHEVQVIFGRGTTKENELLGTLLLSKSDLRFNQSLFDEVAHDLGVLNATVEGYSHFGLIECSMSVLSENITTGNVSHALLY